jgi:hypothetical protein
VRTVTKAKVAGLHKGYDECLVCVHLFALPSFMTLDRIANNRIAFLAIPSFLMKRRGISTFLPPSAACIIHDILTDLEKRKPHFSIIYVPQFRS